MPAIDDEFAISAPGTSGRTGFRRSAEAVQNHSAHHYLDYTAVSAALSTLLELLVETASFPSATINIVDATQQFTLVSVGMPSFAQTGHVDSVCSHVVEQALPIVIRDIDGPSESVELCDALRASGMSAYVGVPLAGREGRLVGALCVMDTVPRAVSDAEIAVLVKFAAIVDELLDSQRDRARQQSLVTAGVVADAVERGHIVPWFQPIVDLRRNAVVGFEALARWEHPVAGVLIPDQFMDVVEKTDIIIDLDLAILARTLDHVRRWRRYKPDLVVSVNLSAQHFLYRECVDRIAAMTVAAGVDPAAIIFELTEITSFDDVIGNVDFLNRLRAMGFAIYLDDVGIGWSTLSRLLALPVDGVKIDKSVIDALGTRGGDAMVRALAGFATETERMCVAEGVETPAQAVAAAELGCTHGQGYLWGRPQRAGRVADVLARVAAQPWPGPGGL